MPALAAAKTVHLKATLTPVHGVASGPHGTLKGRYDTTTQVFHWTVTFRHLTAQAIAVRCLRRGEGDGASAVVLHLTATPPHPLPYAPVTGKAALLASQAKQLIGGHWRVVVSTVRHRHGEIAGPVHKG